jgi:hypothetical protein
VRKCVSTAVLAVLLCLAATSSATAKAVEFGNRCVGNDTEAGWTLIGFENGEDGAALPSNAGPHELWGAPNAVITHWRVQVGPGIASLSQQLLAFDATSESEDRVVGESAVATLHEGTNEFATRIPIHEYDHIGLRGPTETLFCDKAEENYAGLVEGDFPTGESRRYEVLTNTGVPAIAIVEPDVDGDGYGDETQDKCPWRPLFHDPCPKVEFSLRTQAIRRGAALASVHINATATVRASAEIMIPRSKKTLSPRVVPIDLGSQLVTADTPATLRVPLPKVALRRLAKMRHREKLKVEITATASEAPELEGEARTRELTVRIPGRLQPRKPR